VQLVHTSNYSLLPNYVTGGAVYGIAASVDGGFSVGGDFQERVATCCVADALVFTDPADRPDGPVLALAFSREALYLGGAFNGRGGVARTNLAALELPEGR